MQWALLAIATIAAVELVLRLHLAERSKRLLLVVRKVSRTMQSNRISDHWKERAVLAYAGQLFSASVTLLALLVLAFSPFAIAVAIGVRADIPLLAALTDFVGILVCTTIACIYLWLRRFRNV